MASCKNLLKKTPLIHEDTRLPEFANSLQKKISAALCSALASIIWTNFLFVDQEDSSTTPERNSFTKKFGTIQAAVNAAEAGDVILINPGEYYEDLDLSNIVNGVTIQGAGIGETIVDKVDLIKAIGADPIQNITIKDISISGDFFGEEEISDLEEKIINSKHEENDLKMVLSDVNIDDYIKGLSRESFIEGIMNIERANE